MSVGERYELEVDEELRIDVDLDQKGEICMVELMNGYAEIDGTEMVKDFKYKFHHGRKFSVYTYHGCTVTVYGRNPDTNLYKSKEHPMIQYLNIHSALERKRKEADAKDSKVGPVVMVVGPQDVGKTTLCTLLLNYAVRQGRRPIFADLDVSQNTLTVPGNISATLVERPASIEEGLPQNAPLVYHYGHTNPGENTVFYNSLVSTMGSVVHERLKVNPKAQKSGVIINTFNTSQYNNKKEGYEQIKHIAEAFKADVIIVLEKEKLNIDLTRDMPGRTVVWLPKSNGVAERTNEQRTEDSSNSIRQYYYGNQQSLFPHTFDIKFDFLKDKIFKIGAPSLPESCMPLGKTADDNHTKLVPVSLTPKDLLNHILALSCAENKDNIISTNTAGFLVVTQVNLDEHKISVLSPQPREPKATPLPFSYLLLSEVKYIDR